MASTRRSSQATSGWRSAIRRAQARKKPSESRSTFALWTTVTRLRRRAASENAASTMRSEPSRVILRTERATSGVGMNSPGPDMHGAVGVEAFGVLAHDHEIDVAAAARRQARPRPRRPDVGEQVEPAAQLAGRIEAALGDRRIFVVRHRPEDDAGRLLRPLDHGVGSRGAAGAKRGEADVGGLVGEAELELPVGGVEHLHGGGDDFRADAVAGQHQKGGLARTLPAGFRFRQELLLCDPRAAKDDGREVKHDWTTSARPSWHVRRGAA